ncbi:thioredoxin domain-containing protein [Mycobacterium ulcerans]|uniref:Thioredoxin TrxA n=2 Tax=Mycobacterium ulcerans TaxID=1809 RepID=A0PNT1_MYCUA|nr:thioredoxin domain-containing protein [Mycobacterium ulcerans]ABL04000.1 thioredoxin TrxA [Mycobacterium ulcerans Agy99]MEB3905637.1 thioredoxin domain-containing protein [Mycobacterium ulcerans]MEB3909798.1 thioredoxin domain-containing protein [Mycobacterium ulcerans]MEB3920061.1 thioredoxin domain-containing protein [Mycobacterium ulcerans]MEB3924125.1 thioredoxin domain-containing protein [Mycobacterium ulcerans]
MATEDLTAANFKQTVHGNDSVLVYVWAPLCAPCDVFAPTYEGSSDKHPDIVHGKVNFESEQELVSAAAVKHLPTLMAFKKGKLVFKQAGIANPAVMDDLVRHLREYRIEPAVAQKGLL